MARFRLTKNHPTHKKFSQLCTKAEELGLSLSFRHGRCVLTDNEVKDNDFLITEVDDGNDIEEFPPTFDYKLTFEK